MTEVSPSSQGSKIPKRKPMKMIVVKYFEDTDKYAKIIPRPAFHILRRRLENEATSAQTGKTIKVPTKEDAENMTKVFGHDLMGSIIRDQSDWFATYDPITSVMSYNDKLNK